MRILVTGAAGFIGTNLILELHRLKHEVISVDIYLPRVETSKMYSTDISKEISALRMAFSDNRPDMVVHLAAFAGVRQSLDHPGQYIRNNVMAMQNVLDMCREYKVKRLIYASSSSVYGKTDWKASNEKDPTNPISVYGASKKMKETLAETYSNLYQMDIIGLRFFTVYGPYGRPDMAVYNFTDKIFNNKPLEITAPLTVSRSFTYVGDVVRAIGLIIDRSEPARYHSIFNVGYERPIRLAKLISLIEEALGKKTIPIDMQPSVPGDVPHTKPNSSKLYNYINYKPNTSVEEGIKRFVMWYLLKNSTEWY
jgi:UDP-glucuronate 4-epimerase